MRGLGVGSSLIYAPAAEGAFLASSIHPRAHGSRTRPDQFR